MNVNTPGMGTYGATWEAYGYSGSGRVEELLGSLHGRPAIIVGSGEGAFRELDTAEALLDDEPVVFAVNDIGMFLERVDHWVSLHSHNLKAWQAVRWLHPHGRPQDRTFYHSIEDEPGLTDYVWTGLNPFFAISGYFAMQLAYLMGAGTIVLCGCPGDNTRRFFDRRPRTDFAYGGADRPGDNGVRDQVIHEMQRLPGFKAKVRSLSGWTRDFFGGL